MGLKTRQQEVASITCDVCGIYAEDEEGRTEFWDNDCAISSAENDDWWESPLTEEWFCNRHVPHDITEMLDDVADMKRWEQHPRLTCSEGCCKFQNGKWGYFEPTNHSICPNISGIEYCPVTGETLCKNQTVKPRRPDKYVGYLENYIKEMKKNNV